MNLTELDANLESARMLADLYRGALANALLDARTSVPFDEARVARINAEIVILRAEMRAILGGDHDAARRILDTYGIAGRERS